MGRRLPRIARPAAALAAAAVLLAGCGSDGTTEATTDPTAPSATATEIVHTTEVPPLHPSVDGYADTAVAITTADGTTHRLAVKRAVTAEERAHGLMEVPDLPAGTGMLFVYTEDRDGGFWMKNTLVPLDIAYVDAAGRIVAIEHMVPCEADPCPTYPPGLAYRLTLEVPAGWFAANGVDAGDQLRETP